MSDLKSTWQLNKDKWLNSATIGLFVLGVVCIIYVLVSNHSKKKQVEQYGNLDCVKETLMKSVDDELMVGIANKGANIKVYKDGVLVNTLTVKESKLYELIKGTGGGSEHVLEIDIESPGLNAFTFTFG